MTLFNIPAINVEGLGFFAVAYGVFVFIVRIIMSLAVNGDAKRLVSNRAGLFLFGPFLWGWIVLLFGLAGFALYWAVHHSSLRSSTPPNARTTNCKDAPPIV
jgi:hypothetical protein